MPGDSALPPEWLRAEARRAYGLDPDGYEAGRPDYSDRVYEVLRDRCRIGPGTRVVEIGPGTGTVTRRLLDLGAAVTAVEPDAALARHLAATTDGRHLEILASSFEDATLGDGAFDAAVAAMSFHWVNQDVGLPKLGRIVRPGGWVALWWMVFTDPDRPDPFHDATKHLLGGPGTPGTPGTPGPAHFELDVDARTGDLSTRAGLRDVAGELIRWTVRMDAHALRRLYASMIRVRVRPEEERARLLDAIVATAVDQFGGVVDRHLVAALYTGRRPEAG